jgi:aminoglycoside/choline kinase family phosphotransferase
MRLGCAAYDLASLLYDPYQCHPRDLRLAVWREYCRQVASLGGIPPEDQILHLAACQRLMQALGAYGKLWLKDGLDWYRQFIVPGLKMLGEACAELPDFPAFRQMAAQALALAKERAE